MIHKFILFSLCDRFSEVIPLHTHVAPDENWLCQIKETSFGKSESVKR